MRRQVMWCLTHFCAPDAARAHPSSRRGAHRPGRHPSREGSNLLGRGGGVRDEQPHDDAYVGEPLDRQELAGGRERLACERERLASVWFHSRTYLLYKHLHILTQPFVRAGMAGWVPTTRQRRLPPDPPQSSRICATGCSQMHNSSLVGDPYAPAHCQPAALGVLQRFFVAKALTRSEDCTRSCWTTTGGRSKFRWLKQVETVIQMCCC